MKSVRISAQDQSTQMDKDNAPGVGIFLLQSNVADSKELFKAIDSRILQVSFYNDFKNIFGQNLKLEFPCGFYFVKFLTNSLGECMLSRYWNFSFDRFFKPISSFKKHFTAYILSYFVIHRKSHVKFWNTKQMSSNYKMTPRGSCIFKF